jgi:hypothetical protein
MRKPSIRMLAVAAAAVVALGGGGILATANAAGPKCAVTYTTRAQAGAGFVGTVAVRNQGKPVKTWKLTWSFTSGQQVTRATGARIAQSGSTVSASNTSRNGRVPSGATLRIGFVGKAVAGKNPAPASFAFNGKTCSTSVVSPPPATVPPATTTPAGTTSPTTEPAATSTSSTTGPATSTTEPATTTTAPATSTTTTPATSTTTTAPATTSTTTQATSTTSGSGSGDCVRQSGSSPTVRTSDVALGVPAVGYGGEGDTEPLPMAIAATPAGGSWLAWLGTDKKVHLGKLDCDDKLVGAATTFDGVDLQDVAADATGGVILVTRPANQGSGTLCGGTSSPAYAMYLVRFDNSGKQVWEQQVTNLSASRGGYDDGARFVWWYQHHGRLAFDGTNYAAYFGVAITVKNGNCVDIHEGDRMQVVGPNGALLSGHDSFEVGCSHAWTSRIVWDARTGHFAMTCATDNNCRIAQPNPYRTVVAGTCDGTLFGGDLVRSTTAGYWTAWSQGGKARLEHFSGSAPSDKTVTTAASTSHPHLVDYGSGRMLLAWESGSGLSAQVYDAGTGAAVGSQFTIGAKDHDYQAFKAYTDGSVAYPAAGGTSSTIRIARVMPLT